MLHCPRCENELPDEAKFCNNCGLSQTNPLLVAIPRGQKDIQIGSRGEEHIPVTPRISQNNDVLATLKTDVVRPVKANKPIKNGNGNGTVPLIHAPSLKARFIRNTGPIYIGKVVSVGRKRFRRNLLLTRTGLYVTLVILTCLIIAIGFTLVYALSHQTH